ncbi:MAG: peptidylprolyl isomerase [Eubacteriaceae bacterium]
MIKGLNMKKVGGIIFGAALALLLSGCQNQNYVTPGKDISETFPIEANKSDNNPQFATSQGPYAIFETTAGEITVLLYPQEAPKAVENFIALAEAGYYNDSIFHFVSKEKIVQGGRPKEGEEHSATGEKFEDELSDGLHNFHGALSMSNDGMNTNQSQFYFVASTEIPENEKMVSANMALNELIRKENSALNEGNKEAKMSEEELKAFEESLNQKIQAIGTEGVLEDAMARYQPSVNTYMEEGGAYHLDYKNTVFGQVVKGLNVVDGMSQVFTRPENKQPKKDIVINTIKIVETLNENV